MSRMPEKVNYGKHIEQCLDTLWHFYSSYLRLIECGEPLASDTASRYVCGYPIPDFQRSPCWTEAQSVTFIESLWMGLPVNSFTYHDFDWNDSEEGFVSAKRFSYWLIDGQQRLLSIEQYWGDKFPINGIYYSELTPREKQLFLSIKFTAYRVSLWDEAEIKELYNRISLGGTAHLENQRAA